MDEVDLQVDESRPILVGGLHQAYLDLVDNLVPPFLAHLGLEPLCLVGPNVVLF